MKTALSVALLAAILPLGEALSLVNRPSPKVVSATTQRKSSFTNGLDHDRIRYGSRESLQRRGGTVSATLQNELTLYFINVTLGTPPQSFALHIDTGSSDLWVNTPTSQLCKQNARDCDETGVYTQSDSSTAESLATEFDVSYADGTSAKGDYVTDVLNMGGATLDAFQFGVATTSSTSEGILGVGYTTNEGAAAQGVDALYLNLPAALAAAGIINTNAYSLYLNDLNANTGRILFGGVNTAKFTGELATLPIIPTYGYYSQFFVGMSGVGLNGVAGSIASNLAEAVLLDSGTSLTYLPDSIVNTICNQFGTSYNEEIGAAPVSCSLADQTGSVDFSFSTLTISVPLSELVIDISESPSSPSCVLGIAPVGSISFSILGDTFLRSAYVVYDLSNNEISLAQTDFSSTDNVVEIVAGTSGVPSATLVANPVMSVSAVATGAVGDVQATQFNFGYGMSATQILNAAAMRTPLPMWRIGSPLAAGAAAVAWGVL